MWNMALCVTSMINLSILVIHLLQRLCQSCTLWNHYQRPDLTYLYTRVCVIYPSSSCVVHIFYEYYIYCILIDSDDPGLHLWFKSFWLRTVYVWSTFFNQSQSLLKPVGKSVHWLSKRGEKQGAPLLCTGLWLCCGLFFPKVTSECLTMQ